MAAELCRVSLWLEALEPGKPLSFLDHHIRVGNSLLGTTLELIAGDLPDDAFTAIEGDDKKVCSALKKRNKQEREGQRDMLHLMVAEPEAEYNSIAARTRSIDETPDDTIEKIQRKADQFRRLVVSPEYQHAREVADVWCAAFVWNKQASAPAEPVTTDTIRRLTANPKALTLAQRTEVDRLSRQYQFFHWYLAFPEVIENGGFDCVLGNPPWERIKLAEDEWFTAICPEIAAAPNPTARAALINDLATQNPQLYRQFISAKRQADGTSGFARGSKVYPLCGVGDINTYSIFAELNRRLLRLSGRLGCVLQAGIATDKTTSQFFEDIISQKALVSLYSFDNHEGIFPSVKRSIRFCLLTLSGAARPFEEGIRFTFYARRLEQIYDAERCIVLTPRDIALLNPNTKTCPVFQSKRDCDLVVAIYRRIPVLVNEETGTNAWQLTIRRVLDMNKREVLNLCLLSPPEQSHSYFGVYEAKLFDQINHRGATYDGSHVRSLKPYELENPFYQVFYRYWISRAVLGSRLPDFWSKQWLVVWQDVTDVNTMSRTVSGAILPLSGTDFTVRVGFPQADPSNGALAFVSTLNSFVFDYVSRQKIGGTHLSDYVIKQLPFPMPEWLSKRNAWIREEQTMRDWLLPRVLELTYTAWDLEPFAQDCGWSGPPFRWDEERRFQIRCELDAAFFHHYLGSEDEWHREPESLTKYFPTSRHAVDYIMETFPIVKRKDIQKHGDYRTKLVILDIYDKMKEAMETGKPYQTLLDPPPADPRVAHPPLEKVAAVVLPFRRVQPRFEERYQKCLPLLSLKAAAGGFSDDQTVQFEDWVEINTSHRLRKGMFAAQVVGQSMEPLIPDTSYCLFSYPVLGTRQGKIVLVEHHDIRDPETGGTYTLKRYRSEKTSLPDGSWHHSRIVLEPINSAFSPIILTEEAEGEVHVIAEFIEVLKPAE